jgi:hypothetical protein
MSEITRDSLLLLDGHTITWGELMDANPKLPDALKRRIQNELETDRTCWCVRDENGQPRIQCTDRNGSVYFSFTPLPEDFPKDTADARKKDRCYVCARKIKHERGQRHTAFCGTCLPLAADFMLALKHRQQRLELAALHAKPPVNKLLS